ncbi:unnamed protein product [Oppiella nova]|uniref:Uncharacterized protein n=1 Tax=Oppiella nova TaxID=334625 RepID=A0A7R9QAW4_9ACAR|nr:unnamed protein product [Oppiella nova]CAG2162234.1 unnamed protein product [Oppiella nova]
MRTYALYLVDLEINSKWDHVLYNKRDANAEGPIEMTTTLSLVSDVMSEEIKCALNDQDIKSKVTNILGKFVPTLLRLRPIQRGNGFKVVLDNGKLTINKDFKIIGQPVCEETDDQTVKYTIVVLLEDLMGIYDWKIYNLFGNNFSENAIRKLEIQFEMTERRDGMIELVGIRVGKISGFKVDVNIPENIIGVKILKRLIQYFVSRISTLIVNRSMDSIKRNLHSIFLDSIKNKIQIHFNVVKEKLFSMNSSANH